MAKRPEQSVWRQLGQMIGNIGAGIAADPRNPPARLRDEPSTSQPQPSPPPAAPTGATTDGTPAMPPPGQVVNARVQEAIVNTEAGPVRLRRTVIDEVIADPPSDPRRP